MSPLSRHDNEPKTPSTEVMPPEVSAAINILLTNFVLHKGSTAALWQGIEEAKSAQPRTAGDEAAQPFRVSAEVCAHLREGLKMLDLLMQQLRSFYQDETKALHSLVPLHADHWLRNLNDFYAADEPRSQYRSLLKTITILQVGLDENLVDPGRLSDIEIDMEILTAFVNENLLARWKEDWTAGKLARLDQQEQQLVLLGHASMIPADIAQLRQKLRAYAADKFR